ncbi:MAG: signal recognition particle-docking protein FtsY [Acidobacteria bacterium]|nr:signal recognition particle-docking protein FtsY [Acidobacteriota bacterium]
MIQTLFGSAPPKPGLLERLQQAVEKTRAGLGGGIDQIVQGKKEIDAELLEALEMTLLGADLGVRTTTDVLDAVREQAERKQLGNALELQVLIRGRLLDILKAADLPAREVGEPPEVILVVGVNGTGKTTTIGKLARQFTEEGRKVLLCAADTFRAAAIDQLDIWGTRTGTEVIKQRPGADPSAVLFDALQAARARGVHYVIVDTAGRLHTKSNLMAELEKMNRTAGRVIPGAPHEVLLVLDATTGQNGLEQARQFTRAVGVTGIVLTKLDGTAKGGVVIAIARELGLPIRYVGVGEKADDLIRFDPESYIQSLFE